MPALTLNRCAADLGDLYDACQGGKALRLVSDAYRDLCDEFAIAVVRTTVSLVAGQARYAMDETWDGFRSVVYRPTSAPEDARELLSEDGLDDWDEQGTLWRYQPPGEPCAAFLDGAQIVLVPAPLVGSPNAPDPYPRLDVEATLAPVVAPNAPLPPTIRSTDAIVYRAAVKWASGKDKPSVQLYESLYDGAITRLERFVRRRNKRQRNQSYPEGYSMEAI